MPTEKSRLTSFILTLLFGPLGLLYSSALWALVMIVLALVTAFTIVGPFVIWLLSIAIGDHLVHKHNQSIKQFMQMVSAKVPS